MKQVSPGTDRAADPAVVATEQMRRATQALRAQLSLVRSAVEGGRRAADGPGANARGRAGAGHSTRAVGKA